MKLYTEEQMIKAFEYGKTLEPFDCFDDMINSITPIELPNRDEIFQSAKFKQVSLHSFIDGAEWLIKKIKQQGNGK